MMEESDTGKFDRAHRREAGKRDVTQEGIPAVVTDIVDGDTVVVRIQNKRPIKIQMIGVDAPESSLYRYGSVECLGRRAARFTRASLQGATVRLEFDLQRLDVHGRTLAYVWKGKQLINEVLLRRGYALARSDAWSGPNTRYEYRLLLAEERAFRGKEGVWGHCTWALRRPLLR